MLIGKVTIWCYFVAHFSCINVNSTITSDKVIISIQDTGYGMEKEELDKIFEPFYRVDKSRFREMGGSGLGLSIVKKII